MSKELTCLQETTCFGGRMGFYRHESSTCRTSMKFAVYQPPQAQSGPLPVLYFLSGLTCTEENFMIKAGAQRYAADYGLILVAPDTSPRDGETPGAETDWDLGTGAGFYVDALLDPWAAHYQMYRYVVEELPQVIEQYFPVQIDRQGICGHSMGGHGALVCGLRNRDRYRSISALAPIAAPMRCPWGQKIFSHYLGPDQALWRAYDASELVYDYRDSRPLLVDQGAADSFLAEQLRPDLLQSACEQVQRPFTLRLHPGYDHSYYFIATFIGEHLRFHAEQLQG
ncbi:MAG: S-formylglutathione hydrolase [Acaryochloridaceae cyanobacterium SU_2_1]|nr:S-formylglutathione hydrolase [Acaryochloridaceae cyanobacterium SU_2_1]